MLRMQDTTHEAQDAGSEMVAFLPVDGGFEPFLDLLPHAIVARLMGPDADEAADPLEF